MDITSSEIWRQRFKAINRPGLNGCLKHNGFKAILMAHVKCEQFACIVSEEILPLTDWLKAFVRPLINEIAWHGILCYSYAISVTVIQIKCKNYLELFLSLKLLHQWLYKLKIYKIWL